MAFLPNSEITRGIVKLTPKGVGMLYGESITQRQAEMKKAGAPFHQDSFIHSLFMRIQLEAQEHRENPDAYFSVIRQNPDELNRIFSAVIHNRPIE